jgi:hypothetical protein
MQAGAVHNLGRNRVVAAKKDREHDRFPVIICKRFRQGPFYRTVPPKGAFAMLI